MAKNTVTVNEDGLKKIIKEAIEDSMAKNVPTKSSEDEAIRKWVMWCYNFERPEEFIKNIWGGTYLEQHLLNKFTGYYERYGAEGVMNRFFVELDSENKLKLTNYVLNNFRG